MRGRGHCLRMLSFPRISGNLETPVKSAPLHHGYIIHGYTNLREARRLLAYKGCLPLTSSLQIMRDWRRYSALRLQELSTRSSIPAKRCGTWMTQSLPLKFTDHLERSNADRYRQSDIVFDFNIARVCPTGSITMQCGLSGGKQKLTVILV